MVKLWRRFREGADRTWSSAKSAYQAIVPIFRPIWPAIRFVALMLVIDNLFDGVYPLIYGKLTDALVSKHAALACIFLGVVIAQGLVARVISYIREMYEIEHIDWDLNLRIMNASLEKLAGFSMAQCAQSHTSKTRDVVNNGRRAMKQLVFMAIYRLGPVLLELLIALAALVWFCPAVGGIAILGTIAYLAFATTLFMQYRPAIKALEDRANENGKLFSDVLANMEVVMAFARQQKTLGDFEQDGQELANQGREFWRPAIGWYYARNGLAFACKIAITAMTAYLLFKGQFSFGMFVALSQWATQAVNATQQLGQMQRELSQSWADMELYLELLQQPPSVVMAENAIAPHSLRGHITFEDVTFEYQPRSQDKDSKDKIPSKPIAALKNVSFEIPPGQKVALVGESGAGKSTVAYALMRAADPKSGVIRLDGHPLTEMDLSAVRHRIGYVPQQPRLFARKLRYNLTFGLNGEALNLTDDKLREVLSLVKLDHLAKDGGLDSNLGENGHTLSGGERQRLCIARALIKNPDVLIFDEATSSLDPVNEKKVQDAIDEVTGRTQLIIAHRYSTIREVDRILVFDSGQLVDDGTHQELLQCSEYYRALLEQQGLL